MSDNAGTSIATLQPGDEVKGHVRHVGLYGAMVDIGAESDALLHLSQLGRKDFQNLEEVVKLGDEVEAFVLKVDEENKRIALTMVKPPALPWEAVKRGDTYKGTVTRIEPYGVFVDIGAERPGMVHISELTDGYVERPEDVVNIGDEVEARVIKMSRRNRQIDLSMRTPEEEVTAAMAPEEEIPTAMEIALRRAQQHAQRNTTPRKASKGGARRPRRDQDDIYRRTLRDHYGDED
ncbi:30S ribosomal protein S1 [Phototrophicus methaneseepsis]|uniref:30S ribosomal protein S1 n=1 Tax=Phototrophicus methaneseepsis TaxID=2710758 RepID=A0A7S8E6U9_9CHLR|nr:S1 RNA-binding domain-containing protein [Phototrophicus methaneseepsis]QPC81444.1 30S ribosomal protein S1 [Phototrophicus methaneseepsis]